MGDLFIIYLHSQTRFIMIKKYLILGYILLLLGLLISTISLYNSNVILEKEVSTIMSNQKAFIAENTSLKEENRVFKFTIEQLSYYKDSLITKMDNVRKNLNIKDKELIQMQYILDSINKKDTIEFKDTLFNDDFIKKDTIIGNEWYKIEMQLHYPNIIITNPTFKSEKYIVVSNKKETIQPPHKYWFIRLFQKKHRVLKVDVIENNPYIESQQQRFIEIIK